MSYSHAQLEEAKTRLGFDAYVSNIIATNLRQASALSVELLTAEVRTRFNMRKMSALTDQPPALNGDRPRTGSQSKFVAYRAHDKISAMTQKVVVEYYRLEGQSNVRKAQVRSEAKQIESLLQQAVTSIPLSTVAGPGPKN